MADKMSMFLLQQSTLLTSVILLPSDGREVSMGNPLDGLVNR